MSRQTAYRAVLTTVLAGTPLALMSEVFLSHDVIPKVILILVGAAAVLCLSHNWIPARGPFVYLLMAQTISLVLSTAFSTQPALSLVGTTWRRFGLIEQLAILVIAAAAANLSKQLLRPMILCGGIAALYGIAQYFGLDPFLDPALYTVQFLGSVVRPPATMGHAIYFAAYLVPIALLAASEAQTSGKGVYTAVCLLAVTAIILSGSRGAVLAVIAGGLMLARRVSKRTAATAAIFLAAAIAFVFSPPGENFRTRLRQWYTDPGGTRLGVWRDTPTLIRNHPILGTGPETFAKEFRAIESPELSRAYPDFYHETPHNAFLDAAAAQGVPGALILIALFAFALRAPGADRGVRAALTGLLIVSLFASLTLVTAMLLWTLAGLLLSRPNARPTHASPAALIFIAAAIILAIQDRAYENLQDAVDDHNLAEAVKAFHEATSFPPGIPGYELWASRQFATLKAWDKAAEAAALAEKQGEEPFNAAYQSAVLAVARGDAATAESKAREAIRQAPNWYKPHLLLAQLLQATNRNTEAAAEIQTSRDLGWRGSD